MKRLVGALLLCASTALGQANGWQEIQNGWGEIQNVPLSGVPTGCTASSLALFLGSPVAMGCDAGISYDAATDKLSVGALRIGTSTTAGWVWPSTIGPQ